MEIKTEIPGIYRDNSGALINKDTQALLAYKRKKELYNKVKNMEEKISFLMNEVARLNNSLESLKNNKVE